VSAHHSLQVQQDSQQHKDTPEAGRHATGWLGLMPPGSQPITQMSVYDV